MVSCQVLAEKLKAAQEKGDVMEIADDADEDTDTTTLSSVALPTGSKRPMETATSLLLQQQVLVGQATPKRVKLETGDSSNTNGPLITRIKTEGKKKVRTLLLTAIANLPASMSGTGGRARG